MFMRMILVRLILILAGALLILFIARSAHAGELHVAECDDNGNCAYDLVYRKPIKHDEPGVRFYFNRTQFVEYAADGGVISHGMECR